MDDRKILTYFELIYNLSYGLMLPNCKFKVLNSEDNRIYEFKDGDCVSCDDEKVRFEDMYKNCKLFDIKLEILNENSDREDLKYPKNKYYTEEEFFNNIDNKEYDTWDDTPREVAFKNAKKEVIKQLEKLYIQLDMEIDSCQGCMENLNQAFEELHIYEKLIKQLGGNLEEHKDELLENYYKEAINSQTIENELLEVKNKIDGICKKLN